MIQGADIDPRTKLCVIACITTLALMLEQIYPLVVLCVLVGLLNMWVKSPLYKVVKRLRSFIGLLITMIFVQSIFTLEGHGIIVVGHIQLLTDIGLTRGLVTIARMIIMILCGTFLTTTSARVFIQGLIQLKIPYELAFMVMIGMKWIPLLGEEFRDSLVAIELRGVKISQLSISKKAKLYTYMITPILVGTIVRSQRMAIAMSCKGLRAMDCRTSYITLQLRWHDYMVMAICICLFIGFLWISYS